jgi:radical SAM protein with 4Fe4S-binding SPASM domain
MDWRSLYYDAIIAQAIFRQAPPRFGPRIVQINISDNCNLDCAICNRSSLGVQGLLDSGKINALIDELYSLGTQEIFYHGLGEPACHPQLPQIINNIRTRYPKIRQHLVTNGTWTSPDLLDAILRSRVRTRFSMHAGDPETWQRIHPRDDLKGFEQAGENLRKLTSHAPELIEILYVICNANSRQIPEMISFASSHRVQRALFRPMRLFEDRQGRYMNSSWMPSAEEYREASRTIAQFQKGMRGRLFIESVPFVVNSYEESEGRPATRSFFRNRSCYIGYVLTVIERDGNVWGCMPESSAGIPLGNIHQSSFKEIWHGRKYREFRSNRLLEEKESLDAKDCHSYCQHLETNLRLNWLRPWRRHCKTLSGVPK